MGTRSYFTSLIVSVLIMSIMWEISDAGVIRNITGTFAGKIIISIFVVLLAQIIGSILSGGK